MMRRVLFQLSPLVQKNPVRHFCQNPPLNQEERESKLPLNLEEQIQEEQFYDQMGLPYPRDREDDYLSSKNQSVEKQNSDGTTGLLTKLIPPKIQNPK